MKSLHKEPLLHFFAIGAVIFALNAWREKARPTEASVAQIEVTAAVIDRLRAGYERQFGKVGFAAEVKWLSQLKSENTLKGDYIWLRIGAQF